jgi:hypothetical protein
MRHDWPLIGIGAILATGAAGLVAFAASNRVPACEPQAPGRGNVFTDTLDFPRCGDGWHGWVLEVDIIAPLTLALVLLLAAALGLRLGLRGRLM